MVQTCIMFSVVLICIPACVIASKRTWFDAQLFCHNKTQKLITDTSNVPQGKTFWTGHYISLSRWIKILGCYDDGAVVNRHVHRFKMKYPSHGLCQEECLLLERITFGLKNDTCICLQGPIQGTRKSPTMCNYICNQSNDNKFSTACGGRNTYNFFQTDLWEADSTSYTGLCLAIECEPQYTDFKYQKCSTHYGKVCQSAVNESFLGWTASMTNCISSGSYLFADIGMSNSTSACLEVKQIRNKTGQAWLGIAKQQFISIDRGTVIPEGKKSIITKCETCKNKVCTFRNCSDRIETTVECVPISTSTTSTTAQTSSTSAPTTTSVRATVSTLTASTSSMAASRPTTIIINSAVDDDDTAMSEYAEDPRVLVSIVVPVVVLVIIGAALWFFVYKRRQKKEQTDELSDNQKTTLENQINNIESDNSRNNNSYFVLEPANSCYEIADSSRDEAENPYSEGKEGLYDHLRDTESRRKVADDMYQHTPFVQNSDYDFTGRTKEQESDDTYDHANMQKKNSDIQYDTLQRAQ